MKVLIKIPAYNEEKSLKYSLKIKNTDILDPYVNTADTYSKMYKRDSDTVRYTPKSNVRIVKKAGNVINNNDGTYCDVLFTEFLERIRDFLKKTVAHFSPPLF